MDCQKGFVSTHDGERIVPILIDVINPKTGLSAINGENLEQMSKRYPNVQVMDVDQFVDLKEAAMSTEPKEITKHQFIEALETLPPMNWTGDKRHETFLFSEFMSGRVTGHYCRYGNRYFTFYAPIMPHEAIVAKVGDFIAKAH